MHKGRPSPLVLYDVVRRYADTDENDSSDVRTCVIDRNDDDPTTIRGLGQWLKISQERRKYYCSCKSRATPCNPCAHVSAVLSFTQSCIVGDLNGCLDDLKPQHEQPVFCG